MWIELRKRLPQVTPCFQIAFTKLHRLNMPAVFSVLRNRPFRLLSTLSTTCKRISTTISLIRAPYGHLSSHHKPRQRHNFSGPSSPTSQHEQFPTLPSDAEGQKEPLSTPSTSGCTKEVSEESECKSKLYFTVVGICSMPRIVMI